MRLNGWELNNSSIISALTNKNLGPNRTWFSSECYAENEGHVLSIENKEEFTVVTIGDDINSVSYDFDKNSNPLVKVNDYVKVGDAINSGSFINNTFKIDISRILLAIIFLIICIIIRRGAKKMKQ